MDSNALNCILKKSSYLAPIQNGVEIGKLFSSICEPKAKKKSKSKPKPKPKPKKKK
jgi:hypothetical protein